MKNEELRKWKMKSEEWRIKKMKNEKWKVKSEEWRMKNLRGSGQWIFSGVFFM